MRSLSGIDFPVGEKLVDLQQGGREMAIKVYKVADIVENHVAVSGHRKAGDAVAVLTNLRPAHDPIPGSAWQMELLIGEGPLARRVTIDLAPVLSKSHPTDGPVFLGEDDMGRSLVYFRNRLFMPERSPKSKSECDEITLRVKKATYDEEADLSNLRAAVANLEAAIEYRKTGPKRDPIPEDVKLVVWARDGGSCVRCGAKQDLHFDHIIPLAKGGGNMEANIQILCQTCNLKKSDNIGIA
jgi:HNH endonuclease